MHGGGLFRRAVVASVLLLLLALACAGLPAAAVVVAVNAGEKFIVREVTLPGQVIMFAFQMNPDFVFPVVVRFAESGLVAQEWHDNAHGFVNLPASKTKREYIFEFDNTGSMLTSMNVNFDIRIIPGIDQEPSNENLDPIEKKIRSLYNKAQSLRGLQQSLRYQQKDHRATVEDVSERVLLWSIVQVCGFFVAVGGQLFLLRRFLEKRRTV